MEEKLLLYYLIFLYIPGPLAPPCIKRPKRKITARSYSWTTCKKEEGQKKTGKRNARKDKSKTILVYMEYCTNIHWGMPHHDHLSPYVKDMSLYMYVVCMHI